MYGFRHCALGRAFALQLAVSLALPGCSVTSTAADIATDPAVGMAIDAASGQTDPPPQPEPDVYTPPMSIQWIIETREPKEVVVTRRDSSVVEFRHLSARGDTLLGVGGPPGPGVKSEYAIPAADIIALRIGSTHKLDKDTTETFVIAGVVVVYGVVMFVAWPKMWND